MNTLRSFFALFVSLLACMPFRGESAESKTGQPTRAGWAEVDITPPLGIAMGGRGPTETAGKEVRDPLRAHVLFLQDAKGAKFVLVSMDLIGINQELSERLRLAVVHETGADWNLVVLNCSHTHSGPQMIHTSFAGVGPLPQNQKEYYDLLSARVLQGVKTACKAIAPVKVEVFEGKSKIAINRRNKNKQGHMSMLPNANGPIAEKVWIMKLTPEDGKAPALVFSYACHPVIVYGSATSAISADFPGVARQCLREKLGTNVHAQFVQGLAGNVRPRILADLGNIDFKKSKPEDVQTAGSELAKNVMDALHGAGRVLTVDLAGAGDRPSLPRGEPPPRSSYERLLANTPSKPLAAAARYWLERYDSGEGFSKAEVWQTGLIRLAEDQWVCVLAGEPCVEWEPIISKCLSPCNVVLWGYSQQTITYLPVDALLPEGGYEVLECNRNRASSPAPFAQGVDNAIRNSLLRQRAFIETKLTK